MDKKTQETMFSSKSEEWETPGDFYDRLHKQYKFTLDPCATPKTAKCEKYYTKEDDGLSKNWSGHSVFVNPPYGREIKKWVEKSYEESRKKDTTVVMLIPARTDTKYWHEYCMHADVIFFVKGRLHFKNKVIADYTGKTKTSPAPFPSAVIVFYRNKTTPRPIAGTMINK